MLNRTGGALCHAIVDYQPHAPPPLKHVKSDPYPNEAQGVADLLEQYVDYHASVIIYIARDAGMTFKLQTRSNWSVREGTAKEIAPQLKDKESEVLAIVVEREDPLVRAKFKALKNLICVIDTVVDDRAQRKWKDVIEALTPDVPLSENRLTEARMFAEATRAILESKDFVRAQDIARVAHFSRKNPSSQPNRWKRAGQIFAVSYKGADLYPSYALDWKEGAKPLAVMGKILKLFGDKDDWQKAFWFGSVNSYLKNKMPKDLLKSHPEDVLKAAELEALGVQHG